MGIDLASERGWHIMEAISVSAVGKTLVKWAA